MAHVPNALLGRLVGCRLYSVRFVMDYLQLHFDRESTADEPLLRCDAMPVVTGESGTLTPADLGWADALRALIPGVVTATDEGLGRGLRIEFGVTALRLRPTVAELDSAEIAMLTGFVDRDWMVWRPGEDTFADLV